MTHAESGDEKTKSDDGILSDYSTLVLSHKKGTFWIICYSGGKKYNRCHHKLSESWTVSMVPKCDTQKSLKVL